MTVEHAPPVQTSAAEDGGGPQPPELSVVIFTRDDGPLLRRCLRSWAEVAGAPSARTLDLEVLVVDNVSQDDTAVVVDACPFARRIELRDDTAFSLGNNRGLAEARAPVTVFCNPDVEVNEPAVSACRRALTGRVGLVGPRLIWAEGDHQPNGWRLPSVPQLLRERLRLARREVPADPSGTTEVGWLMGCFLMGDTEFLRFIGGFDEAFWFHGTDLELCARVWATGRSVLRVEEPVLHVGHRAWSRERVAASRRATRMWVQRDRPSWEGRLLGWLS